MRTDSKISINITGEDSGDVFKGTFTVNTLLSRRDVFMADEVRRRIIGIMPESVPPGLLTEAYMIGHLQVRILTGPEWWDNSEGGETLADKNVIVGLFKAVMEAEEDRKESLKEEAEGSRKRMKKKQTSDDE